jgi:hypothetical protein
VVAEFSSAAGRLDANIFLLPRFQGQVQHSPNISDTGLPHSSEFRAALIPIIMEDSNVGWEPFAVQLDSLLMRPFLLSKTRATIVIDALDECEDRQLASAILRSWVDATS